MSADKTGGPAYPVPGSDMQSTGMTLLDHFAGLAMQGRMAACGRADGIHIEAVARNAYKIADAMLEARKKHLEALDE